MSTIFKFIKIAIALALLGAVGYFVYDTWFYQEPEPIYTATINPDLSADVAMLIRTPDGHGAAVIRESGEISQVVARTADGETGVIEVDERGLPETSSAGGYVVRYFNYTPTTVDLEVTDPDGNVREHKSTPLNLPKQRVPLTDLLVEQVVKRVQAAGPSNWGPGGNVLDYVNNAPPPGDRPADGPSTASIMYEYVSASPGTALNLVSCSLSGGISALYPPALSVLWTSIAKDCGMLAVRIISNYVDIGDCQGDVLDCATDRLLGYMDSGHVVSGFVIDANSDDPVPGVTLEFSNKTGGQVESHTSSPRGGYMLTKVDPGSYTMSATGPGLNTREVTIAVTSGRIKAVDAKTGEVIADKKWPANSGFTRLDIPVQSSHLYDGTWSGVGTGLRSSDCGSGAFTLNVQNSRVTGSIDAELNDFVNPSIEGSVVGTGKMTGKVRSASVVSLGSFEAWLQEDTAKGIWWTTSPGISCRGTLEMHKN